MFYSVKAFLDVHSRHYNTMRYKFLPVRGRICCPSVDSATVVVLQTVTQAAGQYKLAHQP